MDPNVLQALIGNLSFGLQSGAIFQQFQDGLRLPDDGNFTLVATDTTGKHLRIPVKPGAETGNDMTHDLGYHSVFVLNQQIYFGKLKIATSQRFVTLQQPHYLVPHTGGKRELRLVRAGEELHQPMSEMTINMAYVIMWQPLADESVIVQAIEAGRPQGQD